MESSKINTALAYPNIGSTSKMPSVTFYMLMDRLQHFDILHKPKSRMRSFKWFISIRNKKDIDQENYDNDLLFVCESESASDLIDSNPTSYFLILSKKRDVPDWVYQEKRQNRVIVVNCTEDFFFYERLVQNLFIDNLIWENNMDYTVYAKGKADRLLSISAPIINNFICITDTGFNLIAHSKEIEPPSETYAQLVQNGCYSKEEIGHLKKEVLPHAKPRNNLIVCMKDNSNPYTTLHSPLYINGAYVFHITLVYASENSLEAVKDLFKKFVTRATAIFTDFWTDRIVLESSCHKMLIRLINNQKIGRDVIETQLSLTKIPSMSRFRLLHYHLDQKQPHSINSAIVKSAEQLNDGNCHPFTYEDDLLILCYASMENEAGVSMHKLHASAKKVIYNQFGISAGLSQQFINLKDISFAYEQTTLALKMRGLMIRAYPLGYFNDGSFPVFAFAHIFPFLLLDKERSNELIEYSFSDNILETLVQEDRKFNTDFMTLLWTYLCTERNATETSEQIHVHRNTVVYHIKKFEKRFDLSLDVTMVRNRLLLDFMHYFKQENS